MNKQHKAELELDDLFYGDSLSDDLQKVTSEVIDYFGTIEGAKSWLVTKNIGLGSVAPISLLSTEAGIERVRNSIVKLAHGMTA
ncbi:MbcA/ParS/Xre antitoxin family protein [Aliiglaciecola sp. 2_MG-2023]|uniref:MbcA/ParS/Xre antitoxin family protein n=1 Tax=unclassified Aliiglaciecola TaxID=2593648 RepID=UPI0026E48908|nr:MULTISPECIES: MbcA/ParS/Xre antitoxin family protein [unclassified Aliiglaciecola]MDO6710361.1 MbcA/ParS/Xre antitoxin family protein [Aliiglaciecola sp. 2_MG-2023]MDO6751508.1 MbcA/ParS/Xre antitoxin family protein [Aliiglaciecola sp. 1_MG-2023]